ncbi:MAG: AtpZ/AtpI family protein [Gemmatimonadaceae bacterium]
MTGTGNDSSPRENRAREGDTGGSGSSPAQFAGLGLQMVVAILLFLYLGKWIDGKLGTSWIQVIGVFVGAGLSFYNMYHKLMKAQALEDAERKARREESSS